MIDTPNPDVHHQAAFGDAANSRFIGAPAKGAGA